ncbi:hypothetical protein CRUP_026258 [Coryphaenoides rupestris]|nr:hypothetical protein CRUP_026258 [Coryphaenoides rupestris]
MHLTSPTRLQVPPCRRRARLAPDGTSSTCTGVSRGLACGYLVSRNETANSFYCSQSPQPHNLAADKALGSLQWRSEERRAERSMQGADGPRMTLSVFKSTSGEKLLEIQAHDDEVLCCAFSPDDRLLATCSSDHKVKLFGVSSANEWKSFDVKALFPDSEEVEVHVKCTTWSPDGTRVICAFSPDGSMLLSCSDDHTVRVCEGITGEVMFQSDEQPSRIRCTCLSAEPRMAALGREDGTSLTCSRLQLAAATTVMRSPSKSTAESLFSRTAEVVWTRLVSHSYNNNNNNNNNTNINKHMVQW